MAENNNDLPEGLFDDAEFEKEFADLNKQLEDLDKAQQADTASQENTDDSSAQSLSDSVDDEFSQIMNSNAETSFDDELEGLIGNKAKRAIIVTRLSSAELLAAFCTLADISAQCLDSQSGAVAVLRNLDGDGPEAAAKDLTTVVTGLSALLLVDRADKMTATPFANGGAQSAQLPPPFVLETLAPFVEDLMLGITDLDAIKQSGTTIIDSASIDKPRAFEIIAEHTHLGRGGSSIK